jgi:hypothetical protein
MINELGEIGGTGTLTFVKCVLDGYIVSCRNFTDRVVG